MYVCVLIQNLLNLVVCFGRPAVCEYPDGSILSEKNGWAHHGFLAVLH